jgi:hypothetical protein
MLLQQLIVTLGELIMLSGVDEIEPPAIAPAMRRAFEPAQEKTLKSTPVLHRIFVL